MANDNASGSEPQQFIRSLVGLDAQATCVVWPYTKNYSGYGVVTWDGRWSRAHVVVATLAHGPKPDNREVAHSCANRACVNPLHLRWATHAENMADRDVHGNTARGERGGRSLLTERQVRDIRVVYGRGVPLDDIAAEFNIASSTAGAVATGASWGWFEPDDIPPSRGPVNQHMGKTHCKHGHEFTQANTLVDKRGRRLCRACADVRRKKHADRKAGK